MKEVSIDKGGKFKKSPIDLMIIKHQGEHHPDPAILSLLTFSNDCHLKPAGFIIPAFTPCHPAKKSIY